MPVGLPGALARAIAIDNLTLLRRGLVLTKDLETYAILTAIWTSEYDNKPMDAVNIADATGIPRATVQRKIRDNLGDIVSACKHGRRKVYRLKSMPIDSPERLRSRRDQLRALAKLIGMVSIVFECCVRYFACFLRA